MSLALLSLQAFAESVRWLLDQHPKQQIASTLSESFGADGVTIYVDGKIKRAINPAHDYINEQTIRVDLHRLGVTPEQFAKKLDNKLRKSAEIKSAFEAESVAREKRMARAGPVIIDNRNKKKAALDKEPLTTNRGYVACYQENWLDDVTQFSIQKDTASYQAYLSSGKCFLLRAGLRVTVVDFPGLLGGKTGFFYQGQKLWP